MNLSDAPKKQAVPFGVNGQREELLNTTPAGDNSASYSSGFPPVTMLLKAAGGLPPKGQDMNQILYELSALCRWFSAGAHTPYDAEFSSSIGGYPKGAVVLGGDGSTRYLNSIDSNTSNPDSGGTGWTNLSTAFQPLNAKLTAFSALTAGVDGLGYFTGNSTMAITALTAAGRSLIGQSSVANMLSYLGLGTASARNVGNAANQIPDMSSFASGDGWMKFPNGKVIQYGYVTSGSTSHVDYPIPFPSKCSSITNGSGHSNNTAVAVQNFYNVTSTGFDLRNQTVLNNPTAFYWQAIGE